MKDRMFLINRDVIISFSSSVIIKFNRLVIELFFCVVTDPLKWTSKKWEQNGLVDEQKVNVSTFYLFVCLFVVVV